MFDVNGGRQIVAKAQYYCGFRAIGHTRRWADKALCDNLSKDNTGQKE